MAVIGGDGRDGSEVFDALEDPRKSILVGPGGVRVGPRDVDVEGPERDGDEGGDGSDTRCTASLLMSAIQWTAALFMTRISNFRTAVGPGD